MLKNLLRNILV